MTSIRVTGLALLLLLTLSTTPLFAWGEKGHYIVNEAATFALPTDMPPFFYRAFTQLVWEGYDPDRWRGAGVSLDAVNPPDHFFDYEYVSTLKLPPDRYRAIELLYKSGALRREGITNSTTGFLPWRIAELSERLTNEFRQWRFSAAGSPERKFVEADIIHDAGVLGHFVGDASNPHHSSVNYNGWVEPNPNHYANDCLIHSRFEQTFVSHALSTADVVKRVPAVPQLRTDYFTAALSEIEESHGEVERLYQIDKAGGFDIFKPVSKTAVNFTATRLAAGAAMLRDIWWSAWKNSEKPPKKHTVPEE